MLDYTGKLYEENADLKIKYVQGKLPTVLGGDGTCCDRAGFEGDEVTNTIIAMLCLRGESDFVKKADNIAAAGAGMLVISSYNDLLTQMGCYTPVRG